ncbi:MAG: DNA-binding protein WhiA [Oscillospiraceae bacterium]|nr:DNA-binding protein WhiA [Oscillospiraceae bacterium]
MSFASEVKSELCRDAVGSRTLAVAECCGVLLFCHTFTPTEIRVVTASASFAERLPKLIRRASGARLPEPVRSGGRFVLSVTEADTLSRICSALDIDTTRALSHHINLGLLEEPGCREAFLRGAFLAGGSVTDPAKSYHMELSTAHYSVSRECAALLADMDFRPREITRGGNFVLYYKKSELIEDLLSTLGATNAAMRVMAAKVEKSMTNAVNRKVNCDAANVDKTVAAAQQQLEAIRRIDREYGLDALPEPLQQAALLRFANPEVSLTDLAKLSYPPVSRSTLSYRLKKIMEFKI